MMVYFRKQFAESVVNDCNERIVRHGLNVMSSPSNDHDDDGTLELDQLLQAVAHQSGMSSPAMLPSSAAPRLRRQNQT